MLFSWCWGKNKGPLAPTSSQQCPTHPFMPFSAGTRTEMLQRVPSAHSVAGGQPQHRHSWQGIAPCSAGPALLQLPHRCKIPPSHPSKGPASLPLPGKDSAGGAAPAPPALPAPCSPPRKVGPNTFPNISGIPPSSSIWGLGNAGVYHDMERPGGCSLPPSAGSGPQEPPSSTCLPSCFSLLTLPLPAVPVCCSKRVVSIS